MFQSNTIDAIMWAKKTYRATITCRMGLVKSRFASSPLLSTKSSSDRTRSGSQPARSAILLSARRILRSCASDKPVIVITGTSFSPSCDMRASIGRRLDRGRLNGGAGGIRTLDTLLTYTHFPGERLRPLGHRSACSGTRRLAARIGAGKRLDGGAARDAAWPAPASLRPGAGAAQRGSEASRRITPPRRFPPPASRQDSRR